MVRNYQKTGSSCWTLLVTMQAAVNAVINNEMGYQKAATFYGVPQSSLERHVRRQKEFPEQRLTKITDISSFGRKFVLSSEQELQLVNYVEIMRRNLFVLFAKDIRALAFQLARRYFQDLANEDEKLVGNSWYTGFERRHPEICLKKREETLPSVSAARLPTSTKVETDKLFYRLEELASQAGITADRIYNADEVCISFNVRSRVKKSRRRFSIDNGAIVTAEICFSAAGVYMSPMVVYPSEKVQPTFEEGLPKGAKVRVHPSGDFTNELYFDWFKEFVIFSKASVNSPVVLLVNGQNPYIKNLDLLDYANEHGVNILGIPPHSLSQLEPIVVYFVKSLTLFYEDEARLWLQTHLGQKITASKVSPLFGAAYLRAATRQSAIGSFAKTGMWPVLRLDVVRASPNDASGDRSSDFLDQPVDFESPDNHDLESDMLDSDPLVPVTLSRENEPSKTYLRAGTHLANCKAVLPMSLMGATSQIPIVKSPTSALRAPCKTNDGSKIEKKDYQEKKGRASFNSNSNPPSGDIRNNYDPSCLYCNDFYSNAKDGWWLCCEKCLRWAHHSCAGFDDENDQVRSHICKMCA